MKAHDEVPNAEQARAAILLGGANTAQHRTLGAGGGAEAAARPWALARVPFR